MAKAKLKFPYTMYCPRCKAALKIKSPNLVGQKIACPKCKKQIDVVTPDEDGAIPYGVQEMPEEEPPPEPTEEELEEKRLAELKVKRKAQFKIAASWSYTLFLVAMLAFFGWLCYKYIYIEGYLKKANQVDDGKPKLQEPK